MDAACGAFFYIHGRYIESLIIPCPGSKQLELSFSDCQGWQWTGIFKGQ